MGEIAIIDTKQIEQETNGLVAIAPKTAVIDIVTYQQAGQELLLLKEARKKIIAWFKPHKDALNRAKDGLLVAEKVELAKIDPLIEERDKAMTTYTLAEATKRRAEEERLRQIAVKAEEEERLQAAIQAEKEGEPEVAEAILSESVYVPPPIVETQAPKIAGLTMRDNWKFLIIDEKLIPREYLMPDEVKIGKIVRALKEKTSIAGIKAYSDKNIGGARQ